MTEFHQCCTKCCFDTFLSLLQFQFKEIVLTEEEKRLLSKEGATIPTHMPLTKVSCHLVVKVVCGTHFLLRVS